MKTHRLTCCEFHNLPAGCNQGRECPERAREDEAVYAFDDVMHALRYGLAVAAISGLALLASIGLALVLSHLRL